MRLRCDLARSAAKTGILGWNKCSGVNAPHQQLMLLEEKLEGREALYRNLA